MLREWPTKGGPFLVGFSYWGTHIANVCHLCWSRCGTNRMKLEFNTSHLYLAFRGFLRIYHAVISCNKWPNITKLFSPKGIPRLIIPYCTTWWPPIIRCYQWGCRPNNYSYINIYHVYIPHQTKCRTSCVPCNSSAFLKWLNGSLSPRLCGIWADDTHLVPLQSLCTGSARSHGLAEGKMECAARNGGFMEYNGFKLTLVGGLKLDFNGP